MSTNSLNPIMCSYNRRDVDLSRLSLLNGKTFKNNQRNWRRDKSTSLRSPLFFSALSAFFVVNAVKELLLNQLVFISVFLRLIKKERRDKSTSLRSPLYFSVFFAVNFFFGFTK